MTIKEVVKMRRIRHDVSYLVSAGLLMVATVTATTGLVSDLWDLNEFVYHKYAGYTTAVLALIHVYLHWGRLVGYARWRLGRGARERRSRETRRQGEEGKRQEGGAPCHPLTPAPSLPRPPALFVPPWPRWPGTGGTGRVRAGARHFG